MKAAVLGENGVEVRDLPKPEPEAQRSADPRARDEPQPRRPARRLGPSARPRRRRRRAHRARMRRRGRGGRQRGEGLQGRRPRDGARRPAATPNTSSTDEHRATRIPANNMTYEQAACMPVALQTLHNAIVTAGRFKRGETLLIQGASSGVGLMGHADRQGHGRSHGDGHLHQSGAAARGSRTTAAISRSTPPIRNGRSR